MCAPERGSDAALLTQPRLAEGRAADPINLEAVDEVSVTTLVDNVYDALLSGDNKIDRAGFKVGREEAQQFVQGSSTVGLRAEHGFSALVTVRRDSKTTSLLFDTGLSSDALAVNADRLGVDFGTVQAVVLSHGHFDHAGGLMALARRGNVHSLPMLVHPNVWSRRRMLIPDGGSDELPTLSRRALESEGLQVIERRVPSLLLDACVLLTGEVDRTTEYERGMPASHQAWTGLRWEADPQVIDDQALVVNVRGRGLVVVTGCAHAGAINIVRHAQRLTGVTQLAALVGGLHLSGPTFEPVIGLTTRALVDLNPGLIVPGHCTGWRAQHTLAAALPDAWTAGSSGSSYHVTAA